MEKKWIKKWEESKVFEPEIDKNKKKFFATFPYPYINLFPHIGHFYSLMRDEAYVRYKRMQGFNVLFPQAWHCTGSPMVNAALRVQEGEENQINTLKKMGFSDKEIKKFTEPKHWIDVFSKGWQEDLTKAGISIDWRRNFITTSLNPHYNKFIEWQFRKLKQKGCVKKGKKPVIWCERCNQAIGDHARVKGEGETPQEYTIIKLKKDDLYVCCASLRPETIYGQTNVWIDPDTEYSVIKVNNKEEWIVSKPCVEKLKLQDYKIKQVGKTHGKDLIGEYCRAPGVDREVIILPSNFCDPNVGTGIVTSVPSDAPDDYIGLKDLWENKQECAKYGLDPDEIRKINIIPIIKTKEWGDKGAVKIVQQMKIENQNQRKKLEKARKIIYKAGYHTGVMNNNCGPYAGLKVEEAKEKMKQSLLESNNANLMYEPTGTIVCRCMNQAKVKIVSNQWFLTYGDEKWKTKAYDCLNQMTLYPEKSRTQFNYVIDWLNDWACTHESKTELGTPLPWDKKWVVESLSDSTMYMAYYTIAHKIKDINPKKINDSFFDYIFQGKDVECKISKKLMQELRQEFEYWYPLDFRGSGKDLIQNHMTFLIFIHTAMFPKKHWPKSFGVNGWVTVDGNKMSKSLGNVIPVRKMVNKFGADASRFTVLNGGEGLDDANWDSDLAKSMKIKIQALLGFCTKHYNKGTDQQREIDEWMESTLNRIIKQTTQAMEKTFFRSALQLSYFELQRSVKWYLQRCTAPNKKVMNHVIETQILLLAPITPFFAEEAWEKIGKKPFVSTAKWPEFDKSKINKDVELAEDIIKSTREDIFAVLKLAHISKPKKIQLFVAESWKFKLFSQLKTILEKTRDMKEIMSKVMQDSELKKHGKHIAKLVSHTLRKGVDDLLSQKVELKAINESSKFFENEFKCEIEIMSADESKENKARKAMPGKPAILVE